MIVVQEIALVTTILRTVSALLQSWMITQTNDVMVTYQVAHRSLLAVV